MSVALKTIGEAFNSKTAFRYLVTREKKKISAEQYLKSAAEISKFKVSSLVTRLKILVYETNSANSSKGDTSKCTYSTESPSSILA